MRVAPVGSGGCTWRVVQLVKTVEAACLEGLGLNASCAMAQPVSTGGCSYSGGAAVIAEAFADEAAGGCANVPVGSDGGATITEARPWRRDSAGL